jgi:heterokaryon incompatibility protein (HET)
MSNDSHEKHVQIGSMDKVYAGSSATIIAACSKNSSEGLAGVDSLSRIPQKEVTIGSTMLLQVLPHAADTLLSSTWASRGWTFQEGYLSKCRIIFSDHEVSFLCNSTYRSESLLQTIDFRDDPSWNPIEPFVDLMPAIHYGNHDVPAMIGRQIAQYSRRKLTFAADKLDACLGLVSSPPSSLVPYHHVSGVPVIGLHMDYLSGRTVILESC